MCFAGQILKHEAALLDRTYLFFSLINQLLDVHRQRNNMGLCSSCYDNHFGEQTILIQHPVLINQLYPYAFTTDQYHIPDNGVGGDM